MSHSKLLSVEQHPHMRDSQFGIQDRIDAAVTRIMHGDASMRIPVEATDPDIVLTDCGITINRLEGERDELLEALRRANRLFNEVHPKFNWGASFLDANAIKLLNDIPMQVSKAVSRYPEKP